MSNYKPEEKRHTTSRGLKVRSKSEVLITEMLPDGRVFYWEHCGLMSLKEYREHQKWKMEVYEKAGIVPWKNLIVTYDDEDGNINVGIIESEIQNKLII